MLLDIDKHVNILILSADSDLSDPRAGVFAGRRNILWDGWDSSQPSYGSYLNPTPTRGADCARHIGISQPIFKPFHRA